MATYQPTPTLTWKYENSTGKLYIVATINVDIAANEKVNATKTDVVASACTVTIIVGTSGSNVPVTQFPYYTNIGAGLKTEANVRPRIAALPNVTVTTNVIKNSAVVGTNTTATTSSTNISII